MFALQFEHNNVHLLAVTAGLSLADRFASLVTYFVHTRSLVVGVLEQTSALIKTFCYGQKTLPYLSKRDRLKDIENSSQD